MLTAALKYHDMGLSVFPVNPRDKKPAISSWLKYQTERATKEEIEEWYGKNRHQGIAIVTGAISNIFVVDLDKYKPGYDDAVADKYFPDSLITPVVETMNKGQHLYFKNPPGNLTINAGVFPGLDFRGNGGYVVAPPTKNGIGSSYKWIVDIADQECADLPGGFIAAINNSISFSGDVTTKKKGLLHSVTFNLNTGTRDQTLFHIANCLIKGGCSPVDAELALKTLANSCNPPFPESEAEAKIKSVLQRVERKEKNIQKEVESYIAVTDGEFSVTGCYNALQVVTNSEKTAVRVALSRLKGKVIEKSGTKDGVYKRIVNNLDFIDFNSNDPEEIEYPVKLPLGLNDLVEIYEGNIILIAGEFNSGKTLFMLNALLKNKNHLPIRYISSEMDKNEFRKRFRGFTSIPPDFWHQDDMTDYVKRSMDFHTALRPGALNLIDYMEFKGADFTQGAEMMRNIHDALGGKGLAIVAIQKKQGATLPRSGDLVMEKPRLAISLSKMQGLQETRGVAQILKAKAVKAGKCDDKKLIFEIADWGSNFKTIQDWGYYHT